MATVKRKRKSTRPKSTRIGECRGIEGKIDRALMKYEKADILGEDTTYREQLVRKLRAIKRRCESDVTPELSFRGLSGSAARDIKEYLKIAEQKGWRVERTKSHYMLYSPDKNVRPIMVSSPHRQSDVNAIRQIERDLRKAGILDGLGAFGDTSELLFIAAYAGLAVVLAMVNRKKA